MPFPLNLSSSYLSQRDCKPRRLGLTLSFIAASLAARVLRFRVHWVTLQRKIRDCPGGSLGISGWGCAAGTLEPLTYTRASSARFCYPILE